ncbi:spermatogenesis-associated protein 6 isoform X1 [Petromyzon marinus]|uniref:spermatogenesis-associated protein 6 isoform X1 n=2 Tax=Petromyzon marinus TaxID=7757 RepID=UPI003F7269D9
MPRKTPLKVSVDVTVHAVTCPGAVLRGSERVYMSVCVLGCYAKTRAIEPGFPLLFRQTLHVRKVLEGVDDLEDLTDVFEAEDITFELVQLCPPAGETLATYTEAASSLLVPGPLREVLMTRSTDFSGRLSPRLDFSARVLVLESGRDGTQRETGSAAAQDWSTGRSSPPPPSSSSPAAPPNPGTRRVQSPGYREPTEAWRARCPSPYTERRMCERSAGFGSCPTGGRGAAGRGGGGGGGSQRMPHLGLGPWHFTSPLRDPPAFVVRRVNLDGLAKTTPPKSPPVENRLRTSHSPRSQILDDTSLRGSYRPSRDASQSEGRRRRPEAAARVSWGRTPTRERGQEEGGGGGGEARGGSLRTPRGHRDPHTADSSCLCDPSWSIDSWELVHKRVKGLLKSNRARRTLHYGSGGEDDEVGEKSHSVGSAERALHRLSLARSSSGGADSSEAKAASATGCDGAEWLELWRSRANSLRAAEPHRASLHQEMGRVYRDLYRDAKAGAVTAAASM